VRRHTSLFLSCVFSSLREGLRLDVRLVFLSVMRVFRFTRGASVRRQTNLFLSCVFSSLRERLRLDVRLSVVGLYQERSLDRNAIQPSSWHGGGKTQRKRQ
jgi:hypothetical protein